MSKKYQIFLACGLVAATTRLFAASDYVQLQQQVISNDSILKSLQQSQHAYAINQKYAGRLNNPTFNLELDNLGNSDLKDLDGPTILYRELYNLVKHKRYSLMIMSSARFTQLCF